MGDIDQALRYLRAYNESMAALHLSNTVMASPLTALLETAAFDAKKAIERIVTGCRLGSQID